VRNSMDSDFADVSTSAILMGLGLLYLSTLLVSKLISSCDTRSLRGSSRRQPRSEFRELGIVGVEPLPNGGVDPIGVAVAHERGRPRGAGLGSNVARDDQQS
jgi:hypothetical protein